MSNLSLKKNLIMTALIISSIALCENVRAEEYNKNANLVRQGNSKAALGDTKVPVNAYKEGSAGDLKDRSKGNDGLVTKAAISDSQLNQSSIFAPSRNGQGEAK